MRFNFGDAPVTGTDAAAQIIKYQKQQAANQKAKDFRVWANMYASPFARDLLYKDHATIVRNERRAIALTQKPDAGVKAVAEVSKITDKLVETKQKQAQVQEEIQQKAAEGDKPAVQMLVKADKMLEKKANKIGEQLNKRVNEGVELARAKTKAEQARTEVVQKRAGQVAAAPHLVDVWSKHDALYERNRAKVLWKHDQAEMDAASLKAKIAQLPKGVEKDAKMERLRKEEAKRRVNQELELAKLDSAEAGRLDARARVEGLKQVK